MQDRYVCDIGDFGKYGLLRYLCGLNDAPEPDKRLSLGVVWYLNKPTAKKLENGKEKGDGSLVGYLDGKPNRNQYRDCDYKLYDALKCLEESKKRNVVAIKESGILPNDTKYYGKLLPCQSTALYMEHRKEWFEKVPSGITNADVIFIDPDNGIRADDSSSKHISIDELRHLKKSGKSLIIYHHLARHAPIGTQIESMARCLKDNLYLSSMPRVLRYHRGPPRVYFIVAQLYEKIIATRIAAFLKGPWGNKKPPGRNKPHFESAYPPENP